MGKVKRGKSIARKSVIDEPNVKFMDLPQRSLVICEIQGEDGHENLKLNLDPGGIPLGSIVKVVQRYREEDQEQANKVLEEVMSELKERARYVRPPERIVVKRRRKRMEELSQAKGPSESVKIWMERHPVPKIQDLGRPVARKTVEETISDQFGEYLCNVEVKERSLPADFVIRQAGLKNYMCYQGEFQIDVPEGLVGIAGRYDGQEGRSNRSGKSALLESFLLALQGEARKVKTVDELVFHGESEMGVGLGIQASDKLVSISREYRGTKSLIRLNDNKVKAGEAASEIERLLGGMDKGDFVRTCFVRQGDLESILSRGSTQLKEDIIRWRGLGIWTQIEEQVAKQYSKVEKEVKSQTFELESQQEVLERGRPSEKRLAKLEEDYQEALGNNQRLDVAEERLDAAEEQLRQASKAEECRKAIDLAGTVEGDYRKAKEEVSEIVKKLEAAKMSEHLKKSAWANSRKTQSRGFDGVCPVDQERCPRVLEINRNDEAINQKVLEAEKDFLQEKKERKKLEKQLEGPARLEKELGETRRKISEAEKFLEEFKGPTYEEAERKIEETHKDLTLDRIDTGVIQDEIVNLKADLKRYEEAEKKIREVAKNLEELQTELKILRYIRLMCGKFGIPSMLIENALEEISSQVNLILSDLGTVLRLQFDSERELQRLARSCYECGATFEETATVKFCAECGSKRGKERSDELRPMVLEGNRKQSFGQDSGGGRALIAFATRVAMSKFLGARILFLDEVTGSLDEYHLAFMIRLLHKLPSMGFRQVFVISHQREVDEAMPAQILVVRFQEEGRSELRLKAG